MSVGSPEDKPENIIWIEEVLMNNLEETLREEEARKSSQPSIGTFKSGQTLASGVDQKLPLPSHQSIHTQPSIKDMKVGIAEIELKDENYLGDERIQTLSRIVTGKIKYFIENRENDDERYQYWFIKIPNLNNPQRELSQVIEAAKREISFYTEILPDIKSWVDSHNFRYPVEFRVPTCYYGKYLRPIDETPDLDIITHILDSESLLVLDDLRAVGFGKRHFGTGLLISEAFVAVEEIAVFHVTTWAMQQLDKKKLNWPQLFDHQKFAQLYHNLLESNFSTLQNFLTKDNKHPHAREILAKIQKLRPHFLNKFLSLLVPAEYPFPNTLVHMDLWSENLLFRMCDEDREDEVLLEEADLDCYILDWQMVSYGRPTHDLALLIMLSMEPSYRREHTTTLLQYYYMLFEKYAANFGLEVPFDYAMIKKEYRKSCVLATLMALASIEMVLLEDSTKNRLMEALSDLLEDRLI